MNIIVRARALLRRGENRAPLELAGIHGIRSHVLHERRADLLFDFVPSRAGVRAWVHVVGKESPFDELISGDCALRRYEVVNVQWSPVLDAAAEAKSHANILHECVVSGFGGH